MWKLWKRAKSEAESSLETRIRQLEADFKTLELEWDSVWHKLRKALGRIDKTEALERPKNDEKQPLTVLDREKIVQMSRGRTQ